MRVLAATLLSALFVGTAPAAAQSGMTLDAFVTQANRVPMNPTALLRADARRLMREAERAFKQVGEEHQNARRAGRPTASCPPEGGVSVNAKQMLGFLNAIPQSRRAQMSVTDGIRAWMVSRYPCPGS